MSNKKGGATPMETDPALRQRFLSGMSHAACTVNVVTTDGAAGGTAAAHPHTLGPQS